MRSNPSNSIGRRTFLRGSLGLPPLIAALFAATITVSCSDESNDSSGDVTGSIDANHGHTVTVTEAQLDAGLAATLTLTTGSGHTHTLDLTAQEVMDIAAGTEVVGISSTAGTVVHAHDVTFNGSIGSMGGGGY